MLHGVQKTISEIVEIQGIHSVLLCSEDGFLLTSMGTRSLDMEGLAALAAILRGSTVRLGEFLELEQAKARTIDFAKGSIYLAEVSEGTLVVVADRKSSQALIRAKLHQSTSTIS